MQPKPIANLSEPIVDQVIKDLEGRKKLGIERYGVALQAHNGRKALQDAYEEVLDLAQYLKQKIIEDENG